MGRRPTERSSAGVIPVQVLFGTGLALLGYCPGTTLTAIGEGRRDAMVGALGMLTGALLYVRAYLMILHISSDGKIAV